MSDWKDIGFVVDPALSAGREKTNTAENSGAEGEGVA
jgi:hypothetical protein